MNWAEMLVKLRGYLAIIQDPSAGWYAKVKAALDFLGIIRSVLPDATPFAFSEVGKAKYDVKNNALNLEAMLNDLESAIDKQVCEVSANHEVGKIGDGKLLQLLLPMVKEILPIILTILI